MEYMNEWNQIQITKAPPHQFHMYVSIPYPCNFPLLIVYIFSKAWILSIYMTLNFHSKIENIFKCKKKFTKSLLIWFFFCCDTFNSQVWLEQMNFNVFFLFILIGKVFFYYGKRDLSTAHVSLPTTPIRDSFISKILYFVCVWTKQVSGVSEFWNSIIYLGSVS